jgi:predicted PurR-regulated permease PerM
VAGVPHDQPDNASTLHKTSVPVAPRGLLDRDCQKVLVVLLTLLAGVALLWVLWQVLSPILHTLVLFALAAVLAFALSGPVNMLAARIGSRRRPS